MGKDKGLLLSDGKTWSEIARLKMEELQLPVVLSISWTQEEDYSALFKRTELITDDSLLNIFGPLRGILSTHIHFPEEDILVLAVDMRNMKTSILQELMDVFHESSEFEAYVFTRKNYVEPLCAIYTSRGLSKIISAYRREGLAKHSLISVLENLNAKYLSVQESEEDCFLNFNTPDDL